MITIHLTADDLNNLRFAFSPLRELSASYWTLMKPALYAIHLPWIHEAFAALEGIELPHIGALITPDGQFANFLTPTPYTPRPSFDEELVHLRQTPPNIVQQDVAQLEHKTATAYQFLDAPEAALAALVEEIQLYWQRTLAHHWPRIHAVLESDVLYRARQLALHGADQVFNDLHRFIHYEDQTIRVETQREATMRLDGSGLTLVPLIFMWNDLLLPDEARPGVPVIGYSARGAGLWTHQAEAPDAALTAMLGAGRAGVLVQLTTPLSTSELAERLGVTPGNISLHIARLREAGLVESQQLGKWVFHRLTPRGEGVLRLFTHV
jgi:hypothetical protein